MTTEPQGTQGWKPFLAEKHDLVRMYYSAAEKVSSRPIKTEAGNVAEGVFRSWIQGFLPSRYGVASGFIISSGELDNVPLKHFDVIIYDKLNSPQLWRDGNPDRSAQGAHRPIPIEHVLCVLEVKSTFTKKAAKKAVRQLTDLVPYVGIEPPGDPYPKSLPTGFVSGVVFFRASSSDDTRLLDHLNAPQLPGFFGGIVLSETEDPYCEESGLIIRTASNEKHAFDAEGILSGFAMSNTVEFEGRHHGLALDWGVNSFVRFAYGLIGHMSGTARPGFIETFHGLKYQRSGTAYSDVGKE
jgi:hypothetical protein